MIGVRDKRQAMARGRLPVTNLFKLLHLASEGDALSLNCLFSADRDVLRLVQPLIGPI